jgi:hypothetical protein
LRSDVLLAGLALGIAFGTKWYAVPAALAVLALWLGAVLARRWTRALVVRRAAVAAGAVLAAGGFWLVRNVVESGSPFFPAGWLPIGARADVVRPGPRVDFPLAHYAFDLGVWRHVILPDEWRAFGLGGALLLGGTLAAAAVAARSVRSKRAAAPVLWAAVAAALLALVYAVTPNTATGPEGHPVLVFYSARYLVPAAVPAAAAAAWLVTRAGRFGWIGDVLVLAGVADGLRRAFDLSPGQVAAGVVALGALAAALVAGHRLARQEPAGRRRTVTATAGVAAVVAVIGGFVITHRYDDGRLRGLDVAVDRFLDESGAHERVGIAESWSVTPPSPVYPMFGSRLENRVRYVGAWSAGVNRPERTRDAFTAAVRSGRFTWLVIGRGERPGTTPAMAWAAGAGYVRVAQSPRLALYRRARAGG